MAVCESMLLVDKLDLLLCLVLGKGQAWPLRSRVQGTRRVYSFVGSRGSYARDFLGKG